MLECKTTPEEQPARTDHMPIITTLDVNPGRQTVSPKPNFKAANWDKVRKDLAKRLENLNTVDNIHNEDEFYNRLIALTQGITETVDKIVPKTRLSPFVKRWWSKELSQKRTEVRRLGRKSYTMRGDPDELAHRVYKDARNAYGSMIDIAKRAHWEEFLQSVDERTVWTAHRYASGDPTDGGKARVPTLSLGRREDGTLDEAISNEEKDCAFAAAFFSAPDQDEPPNDDYEYPDPKFPFSPISDLQIKRAISKLGPYKAPGPDGISNSMYIRCAEFIVPHLGPIYRATFRVGVYPAQWKDLVTVVVRKPGKSDYMKPGAYCPIALINTMAKILSVCITEDIVDMA